MKNIMQNTVIQVHGFVMLKGLDNGKYYLVTDVDNFSVTLVLTDKKGKRKGTRQARHYKSSLESRIVCFERGDNNGIEIVKQ